MQPLPTPSPEAPEIFVGESAREFYKACCKSAEITLRSSPVWNAALFGFSWMTLEDAFSAARAGLSCTTIGSVVDLERDLLLRLAADAFDRFCLLLTIGSQIGEEAGYPLRRWMVLRLEKVAPRALA